MKLSLLFISALFLSACSVNVGGHKVLGVGGDENKAENYSYDYTVNGCKTEAHEFSSRQAYCDGLKNESLNNYCAASLRYADFKQNCSDMSWQ